ncbi:MAG TPA: IS5 family transposase [Solirubrobacteraceae bacterium]|jgi:IS5 family transposase|nr:IS5 family transposase [Solirubrobacteraceae bacterium]
MAEQRTFAGIAWSQKGKVTRREQFLAEMDAVIPWAALLALIEPYYPQAGRGRQPLGLEKMLRIYFLQQWFNLSDPQAEDAIYDSEAMRRFARVELGDDVVPDETTILRFRHLLEQHRLTAAIFEAVKELLTAKRLLLKSGTIVDATIIAAPSSTKNAAQARDPEMKQTRKGNAWHFGMKLHVGTDLKGRVHSLTATHAGVADITQLPQLLHGEEQVLYGDQAYWKEADRQALEAQGVRYRVNRRATAPHRPLTARWRAINRARSRTRARGEHPFHVVKRLWGFAKVRYRGIAKNLARAFSLFALANLYAVRRQLLPPQARCVL